VGVKEKKGRSQKLYYFLEIYYAFESSIVFEKVV